MVALGTTWYHIVGGLKVGVLIFFDLSGLLLYRPFVRGRVDINTYLRRRVARILPAYLVAIAGTWLLLGPPPALLPYLFFAQNYDPVLFNGWLGVTWTLQLEVTFYLLLPALALLLHRRQWLLIPLTAVSFFGAILIFPAPIAEQRLVGSLFPFAFWAFGLGMGLAVIEHRGTLRPFGRPASLLLGLALLGTSALVGLWHTIDPLGGIGAFLVVGFAAADRLCHSRHHSRHGPPRSPTRRISGTRP